MSGVRSGNLPNWRFHYSRNVLFILSLLLLFSSSFSLKGKHLKCTLINSCQCVFPNEEGLDLCPLCETDKWLTIDKDNLTIHFQPCGHLKLGNSTEDCFSGVSVCLYNHSSHTYKNLGFPNETSVNSLGINNPIQFMYHHLNTTTIVQFICNLKSQTKLEMQISNLSSKYELSLTSPNACKTKTYFGSTSEQHLSTGSVLVIMFIVFMSIYFVGGALVLKCLRGAEGREMIPNYDFWVNLPGLVWEGVMFTLSGCKTPQAYDRI